MRLKILFTLFAFTTIMLPCLAQTDSVCAADPVANYHVNGAAGSTFVWNIQGNGTILSGQGTDSVRVQWTTVPGTYAVSVREINASGCEGVLQTLGVVVYQLASTANAQICAGSSYVLPDGNAVNTAGTYVVRLTGSNGCDSIVTTVVSVKAVGNSTTNITICASQLPFTWNGNSYNTPGTYPVTIAGAGGCDSVATLVLSVKSASASTSSIAVCDNQLPYTWNGTSYTNAGTYTKTLVNAAGCDSIATLVLNVIPETGNTELKTLCSSQLPYQWNGERYNSPGNYTIRKTNASGCDSLLTLVLSIDESRCGDIFFPSAVAPTGSGQNRTFGALGNLSAITAYSLSIYNRFGELVFTTTNPYERWDTKFRNQSNGNAAFVWYASYSLNGGARTIKKGRLVVIR